MMTRPPKPPVEPTLDAGVITTPCRIAHPLSSSPQTPVAMASPDKVAKPEDQKAPYKKKEKEKKKKAVEAFSVEQYIKKTCKLTVLPHCRICDLLKHVAYATTIRQRR